MLSKYFRLTNYTWMYCEGYYLHRLLANTFEEERSIKVILLIGWGKIDEKEEIQKKALRRFWIMRITSTMPIAIGS